MALKKCKECGGQISKSAKACPHCGSRKNKTSAFTWLVLFAMLFIGYAAFYPSKTPKQEVQKAPLSAEELAEKRRSTGAYVAAKALQSQLHDPKSVEWVRIHASDDGKIVCFQYRAKNAFGAYILEQSAVFYGQAGDWERHCAGQGFHDVTYLKHSLK